MSLTDEQCEQIADWARERRGATGELIALVVDLSQKPGAPQTGDRSLYVHPEDYAALNLWAEIRHAWPMHGPDAA